MKPIKVCLYLEFYHFWNGILFKKIGTGLLSSYRNQKVKLEVLDIRYTEVWDDSCTILQINTPWLWSLRLIKKAKRRNIPVILWSHVTVEDAAQVFRFMPLIQPLFKRYLVYVYGLADVIFAPTEYTKTLLIKYGLDATKIEVQSNGIHLKKFYADEAMRHSGRTKYHVTDLTIGTIGLVIPRKGIDTFLQLAKAFPHYPFLWFGKIYSPLLVKPLPDKIPSNATFTGFINNSNEAYNTLDIFVFPSYEENEGMVILEAAALGLPILVRDIPTYNGWLIDGENCLKAKTDADFVTCLERLIHDPELRHKLGHNAKQLAESRDVALLAKQNKTVYERLLGHS